MELDECIAKRRSIRKFTQKDVSLESIALIIKAGMQSPTAGNTQDWRFVIVREEKQKEKVANVCEEQGWLANASVLIVVCSDIRDVERLYGSRGKNSYAIQDAAAAAQTMLLKATELGIASCWVGALDEDALRESLSLPGFIMPHMILAFGYPAEKPQIKPMLKMDDVIHLNAYGKKAGEYPELGEIIKRLVDKGKSVLKKEKLQRA